MGKRFMNLQDVSQVSRYEEQNPCWHTLKIVYNNGKSARISVSSYENSWHQQHNVKLLDKAYDEIKEALIKGDKFIEVELPD